MIAPRVCEPAVLAKAVGQYRIFKGRVRSKHSAGLEQACALYEW